MINWIKSIFKRSDNPYKQHKSVLMALIDSYFEQRSMRGYIRENGKCDNLEVWAIMEKYVNGDLIEKPKP
jgi:hypothetical protein